ncbi:site-specific integrase [Streptomyces sp. NPDC046237]|uniref:tyrosine-type recombinase/integrase n=1 Tax=Streptomyces sp. NPDC046237 TaxID=3154914 RepID=UPI003410CDC3
MMTKTDELIRSPRGLSAHRVPKAAGRALLAVKERFPPRVAPASWPMTAASAQHVIARLREEPFRARTHHHQWSRVTGARAILAWLQTFPGATWQERWQASPAVTAQAWKDNGHRWVSTLTPVRWSYVQSGLLILAAADVLRLPIDWLTGWRTTHLSNLVAPLRDPEGFNRLHQQAGDERWESLVGRQACLDLSRIILAKGGTLADITVGDAVEYREALRRHRRGRTLSNTLFYAWLRELGTLPPDAPATLRFLSQATGQLTTAELVDRYDVRCPPVRDLLVDYLEERRPALDYSSLDNLARNLARNFWADIEHHHPGIDSLRLPADVAADWKERLKTVVRRRRQSNGTVSETVVERHEHQMVLISVRAFYLDIARWATEEPARWGPWAVPCPVKEAEVKLSKQAKHVKARMDQRTRERLPALPAVSRAASAHLKAAQARLAALREAPPGSLFIVDGEHFTRAGRGQSPWAWRTDGTREHLGQAEHRAFWAWAAVEFLQHTGARIEEMLETTHHSLIQYRLPSTGEIVPLLQIAPSKTDQERVLLVSPELADVLSAIIQRVRDPRTGAVPLIAAYDYEERVWNQPMPLLFQWNRSGEPSRITSDLIRRGLREVLTTTGLTDTSGKPLEFAPHDFRRIFITDAIRSGLPPHIAQVIAGHASINTTMGYHAIYPAEAIEAHRAFITRRRAQRPGEEYRTPTDAEWDDFLGHFERRKLSVGTCARAFGTPCIHEHACIRCSMLRPDPAQRQRLVEIRDNLQARIAEAESEGWFGEIEGLRVSLAGAEDKIAQVDRQTPGGTTVNLGMPRVPPAQPIREDDGTAALGQSADDEQ